MDDAELDPVHSNLHSDPRFIVATTLTTLLVAGSAYLWRSHPGLLLLNSHKSGEHTHRVPESETLASDNKSTGPDSPALSLTETTAGSTNDDPANQDDPKDSKISRPKERRRRGKDPTKEILKSVRKAKGTTKPTRSDDVEVNGIGASSTFLQANESTRFSRSRGTSRATSSRSMSSTSHSNYKTGPSHSDWTSSQGDFDEDSPPSVSTSTVPDSLGTEAQTSDFSQETSELPTSGVDSPSQDSDPPLQPQTPEYPSIPLSTSSSTSLSGSIFSSDSAITPNTSPTLSLSGKTPTLAQPESSPSLLPRSSVLITSSTSSPSVPNPQKFPGPWDWDGAGPNLPPSETFRRPPRFRSKSKGSGMTPVSTTLPASTSSATTPELRSASSQAGTSPSIPRGSARSHDDSSAPFIFPTLNTVNGSSSGSSLAPAANTSGATGNNNGNGAVYGNGGVPRKVQPPRCPPTPGTGTPPPSLSVQTQLASLKGALEAARMREEKTRTDIDRYAKDLDMMRWENVAARRREAELQAQNHHLMHQLQTYATAFASISGQPSSILSPSPNMNGSPITNQSSYSSSPGPHSPPSQLQIPSAAHMLGMMSPTVLSPMSVGLSGSHQSFYPYNSHSLHAHHSHSQLQHPQSPHLSNLYNTVFPHGPGMATTGSGPSSAAGSSSVGSHSPDLNGSPSPAPSLDRGRRRRTRTQAALAGAGESGTNLEGVFDGWNGVADGVELNAEKKLSNGYSDNESDEEHVNEFLADAILKRPESIRSLSSKKGKVRSKDVEVQDQTEFTFPSLSSFGKVAQPRGVLETSADDERLEVDPEESDTAVEDSENAVEPFLSRQQQTC